MQAVPHQKIHRIIKVRFLHQLFCQYDSVLKPISKNRLTFWVFLDNFMKIILQIVLCVQAEFFVLFLRCCAQQGQQGQAHLRFFDALDPFYG